MGSKAKIDCYCINLRRAAKAISDIYDHCLDPVGLSVTQYSLLSNLRKIQSCSVTELANYIGLERTRNIIFYAKPCIYTKIKEEANMLYGSKEMEEKALLQVAAEMCAAARTAPKATGKDTVYTLVLTGEEKELLAQKMDEIGDKRLGLKITTTQTM